VTTTDEFGGGGAAIGGEFAGGGAAMGGESGAAVR
jgi:hypothetical protein